jgi:hypothetical protein
LISSWVGGSGAYEPGSCLVDWESEMAAIDEECARVAALPRINPATEANKAREEAAKKKAAELSERRQRLMRAKRRRARREGVEDVEHRLPPDGVLRLLSRRLLPQSSRGHRRLMPPGVIGEGVGERHIYITLFLTITTKTQQ